MTLQCEQRGAALVVALPAEVDISNAAEIGGELRALCRSRLVDAQDRPVRLVVVDWSAAGFLTMAGTALLEDLHRHLEQLDVTTRVVTDRRLPRKILHLVGLDGRLPLFDSLQQALADAEGANSIGARQRIDPPGHAHASPG
ncbi:STAS domain-containing protein [Streptomyces sp. TRM66268-LWL]|uniref:STAS domain-containing protein n=1 Tax=Streptomyces polyasparticus TaxID=2767826 RepID=A0ABR7SC12_9ACTN|nr:STAS domain-containing protein [Streptomyces polyasparticus]MBC9712559.1 STAS domain-containing protein [Streptomyces polyasparticus]